jgi:hypothetical protein
MKQNKNKKKQNKAKSHTTHNHKTQPLGLRFIMDKQTKILLNADISR